MADLFVSDHFWYYAVARTGLLAAVAIGSGLAAKVLHGWHDYLGKAWTLLTLEYVVLVASELGKRFLPDLPWIEESTLVVANLAGIGAFLLFARAFRAAGLGFGTSRAANVGFTLLALVLAAALVHGTLSYEADQLAAGNLEPGQIVSAIADMTTFVLIAPLLLTTLSLRGGQLFWIFLMLTVGNAGWMVNQGADKVAELAGLGDDWTRVGRMAGFALACCFLSAAALTQWSSTRRGVRRA